ncbi:hypothetical protein BDP67DRAFT_524506, partial [Colletotrichum lupini]
IRVSPFVFLGFVFASVWISSSPWRNRTNTCSISLSRRLGFFARQREEQYFASTGGFWVSEALSLLEVDLEDVFVAAVLRLEMTRPQVRQ